MQINTVVTGAFSTNTYIIKAPKGTILIDPSGKASKLIDTIKDEDIIILLTHGHFDHIKAVDDLYDHYHCMIYMHKDDLELTDPVSSKKTNTLGPYSASISAPIDHLKEGKMMIYGQEVEVYFTPGHTKGSVIYRIGNVIFSGDTLFKESVGRTDLYGGNESDLKKSLRIFKEFPSDLDVYPGHGDKTSIGYEMMYNPFMR